MYLLLLDWSSPLKNIPTMVPHSTGERSSYDGAHLSKNVHHTQFQDQDKLEPIAVVGISFGFPQNATSSEAFWDILMKKGNTGTEFPPERLSTDQLYHPDPNRRGQVSFWSLIRRLTLMNSIDPGPRRTLYQGGHCSVRRPFLLDNGHRRRCHGSATTRTFGIYL